MTDQAAVAGYRLSVTRLGRRLGSGEYEAAAWGGLQDSFPRSGLLSLHARMEGVETDSWEHPSLSKCGDASKITVRAATPDTMDPDLARVELLRRFLHWLGPATSAEFAKWAGVSRSDAETTWKMLESSVSALH